MKESESRLERILRLKNRLNPLYQPTESQSSLGIHRLPGAPPLLEGEAFSSWLFRLQTQFRLPKTVLESVLGSGAPPHLVDTGAYSLDIERIARAVMRPIASLEGLRWQQGSLLSEPRYLCLTTIPLRKRPIFRYCESCLRDDREPYFRTLWRISCVYLCPTHGTVLREFCPSCQQPVRLGDFKPGRVSRSLRHCQSCGADLCKVAPGGLPDELRYFVVARQAELLQLASAKSRLMNNWPGLQPQSAPDFETQCSGAIDMASEQNVRMLFAQALGGFLSLTAQEAAAERLTIDNYMLTVSTDGLGQPWDSVPIAFDDSRVFGELATAICSHVIGRQDLWGGTHWWPVAPTRLLLRAGVFSAADFQRAASWVSKHNRLWRKTSKCRQGK